MKVVSSNILLLQYRLKGYMLYLDQLIYYISAISNISHISIDIIYLYIHQLIECRLINIKYCDRFAYVNSQVIYFRFHSNMIESYF